MSWSLAIGAGLGLALAGAALAQPPAAASLVGVYNGGQTEVAAGLELRADGRFGYALSYGALDERAEGSWSVAAGQVLLTSDPSVPPRFALLAQTRGPGDRLRIVLDVPDGMSRQYFHAEVRLADGTDFDQQLTEAPEPLRLAPGQQAVAVRLSLPMFDLSSEPVPLTGAGGHELHFRFEPNDLGTAAFAQTPLTNRGGELILLRHDLTIRFRRNGR